MWYVVKITRGEEVFYVYSPKWGEYALTQGPKRYLWSYVESCMEDVKSLIQPGDKVEYKRTYG